YRNACSGSRALRTAPYEQIDRPPGTGDFSINSVLAPACAALSAAIPPARPKPATMTSKLSSNCETVIVQTLFFSTEDTECTEQFKKLNKHLSFCFFSVRAVSLWRPP